MSYQNAALYIDGVWIKETSQSGDVLNPATGEVIGQVPHADRELIERALAAAEKGFATWRKVPVQQRAEIMHKAAAILRRDLEDSARWMTLEQGKPLEQSRLEMENCAALLEWSANAAVEYSTSRDLPSRPGVRRLSVRKEPIGPVACFAPWNFPASLAARKVASALATGCSVIVKPAEETPACFAAVVRALDEAGVPAGAVNLLYGVPAQISQQLIESPIIRKVAFTGSTGVGRQLAALAGQYAKPSVMELGGHAPVVIFDDADLERAVQMSIAAKIRNSGQICVCPTRFFIHDSLFDRFATGLANGLAQVRVGDGLEPDTQMGPLANARRVPAVDALVQDAVSRGATLMTGGKRLDRPGFFYAPTVLADVPDDARIMREEPFGPVAVLNRFSDFDSVIARANSTDYALGAYAFTESQETADRVSNALDAGMVSINGFQPVFIDSPISGRRFSGYGSEGGIEGLDAYYMPKFVSEIA